MKTSLHMYHFNNRSPGSGVVDDVFSFNTCRFLALVCLLREDVFERQGLIEYNFHCFREAIQEVKGSHVSQRCGCGMLFKAVSYLIRVAWCDNLMCGNDIVVWGTQGCVSSS